MYNPVQPHISARYSMKNEYSDQPDHDVIRGNPLATRLTRQIATRYSQDPQSLYSKNARASGRKSTYAHAASVAAAQKEAKHPPLNLEQKLVFASLLISLAVTQTLYMNVSVLLPPLVKKKGFQEVINEPMIGVILR